MRSIRRVPPAFVFVVCSVALLALPGTLTRSARLSLLGLLDPVALSASSARRSLHQATAGVLGGEAPSGVEKQIEFYEAEVLRLREQNSALQSRCESLAGTRSILPQPDLTLLDATVSFTGETSLRHRTLVIDRGTRDGVRNGLPVVYRNSLVGRIMECTASHSRVLLITDPTFKTGALAVPTADGGDRALEPREPGVLQGRTDTCILKWVAGNRTLEPGTLVVTTPNPNNGTPRGLVLGQISSIDHGRGAFAFVEVRPLVEPHALEFVTVLIPRDPETLHAK